jgi:plastocyanin
MADPFSAGTLAFKAPAGGAGTSGGGTTGSGDSTAGGSGTTASGAHGGEALALDLAISGFSPSDLEAHEGDITIALHNLDAFPHDFTIDELGVKVAVDANATITETFSATPGVYEFYCSIPGHREAGMVGTLTVLPGAGH